MTQVNWIRFWVQVRQCDYWLLLPVLGLTFVSLWLSTLKWQLLLAIHHVQYTLRTLGRWYVVAAFLNLFLPTTIGGDIYRIHKTYESRSIAVLAVFMERLTGITALLILALLAAIIKVYFGADGIERTIAITGVVTASAVLITCAIAWKLRRLPRRLLLARAAPINTLLQRAGDYARHRHASFRVGVVSFTFHVCRVFSVWLIIYAFGTVSDPMDIAITLALVTVIGLMPISLGGIGLVDGSFIVVMGAFGLDPETGLCTMLIQRVSMIPLNLCGAYCYVVGDKQTTNERAASERPMGLSEREPERCCGDYQNA
jgi:hypothetical protein